MASKKKPAKRKRAAKKSKAPRDWTVDRNGRWRDPSGRFATRRAVLDRLTVGSPEDTGAMLQEAGARVKKTRAKGEYAVSVHFADVGWRSASYATSLDAALMQAGDWLENQLGQQVGFYGRQPVVTDVSITPVKPGKSASLARAKGTKYRQSTKYKERKAATDRENRLKAQLKAAKAEIRELMKARKARRKSKKK